MTKFWGFYIIKAAVCLAGFGVSVMQGEPSSTLLTVAALSIVCIPLFYFLED